MANIQDRMRSFFASARRNPDVLRVGRTYVDVPGTVQRRVACSDGLCAHTGRGRALTDKTCCTTFHVPLTALDRRRIEAVVDEVRAVRDVGAAIDRAGGWWSREGRQTWLRSRPTGACVFLSAAPGGPPRCTIHEWAARTGRDFRRFKPEGCCLYPLYLVTWGDEALVTSYGTELMLEMEPGERELISTFACTDPAPGLGRPVLVEQRDELEYRLGARRVATVFRRLETAGLLPPRAP